MSIVPQTFTEPPKKKRQLVSSRTLSRVYACLCEFASGSLGYCKASNATIGALCGISERSVRECVAILYNESAIAKPQLLPHPLGTERRIYISQKAVADTWDDMDRQLRNGATGIPVGAQVEEPKKASRFVGAPYKDFVYMSRGIGKKLHIARHSGEKSICGLAGDISTVHSENSGLCSRCAKCVDRERLRSLGWASAIVTRCRSRRIKGIRILSSYPALSWSFTDYHSSPRVASQ